MSIVDVDNHNDEDLVEVVAEDIKGDQLLQLPHLLLAPVRDGEMLLIVKCFV